ncbi:MAG: SDR family NAD(P)-dependent oxidoreductase, partial [Dehalococcoidia bacterium]
MVFSETTLKDRVAIITGGGRGIGRGSAIEFAKVGAHLVLAGRTPEKLEEVAGAIRSLGRLALPIVTDIRYPEQVDEMVKRAQEEFGRIDILVN